MPIQIFLGPKPRYYHMNFQMFKLVLEKAEEPEIKLPTSAGSLKKQELQKNIYFCFIDCAKAFDCVDHNKLWTGRDCLQTASSIYKWPPQAFTKLQGHLWVFYFPHFSDSFLKKKCTFLHRMPQWKENRPSIFRPQFSKNLELVFFFFQLNHHIILNFYTF